jgi:hypothetical protein
MINAATIKDIRLLIMKYVFVIAILTGNKAVSTSVMNPMMNPTLPLLIRIITQYLKGISISPFS